MLFNRRCDAIGVIDPLQRNAFTVFTNEVFKLNWVFLSFKSTQSHDALLPIKAKAKISYITGRLKEVDGLPIIGGDLILQQEPRFSMPVIQTHAFTFGGFGNIPYVHLNYATVRSSAVQVSLKTKYKLSVVTTHNDQNSFLLRQTLRTGFVAARNKTYTFSFKQSPKLQVVLARNKTAFTSLLIRGKLNFIDSRSLSMSTVLRHRGSIQFVAGHAQSAQNALKTKLRNTFVSSHTDSFVLSLKQKLKLTFADNQNKAITNGLKIKPKIVFIAQKNKVLSQSLKIYNRLTFIDNRSKAFTNSLSTRIRLSLQAVKAKTLSVGIKTTYKLGATLNHNLSMYAEEIQSIHHGTSLNFVTTHTVASTVSYLKSRHGLGMTISKNRQMTAVIKTKNKITFVSAGQHSFTVGAIKTSYRLQVNTSKNLSFSTAVKSRIRMPFINAKQLSITTTLRMVSSVYMSVSKIRSCAVQVRVRSKVNVAYGTIKSFTGTLRTNTKLQPIPSLSSRQLSFNEIKTKYRLIASVSRSDTFTINSDIETYLGISVNKNRHLHGALRTKIGLEFESTQSKPDGVQISSKAFMRFISSPSRMLRISMEEVIPIPLADQILNDPTLDYPELESPTVWYPQQTRF